MNINLEKVSEVQTVADKLAELPKEALRKKKTVKPAS